MNIQKAIEFLGEQYHTMSMYMDRDLCIEHNRKVEEVTKMLEELEQYRQIGTVKDVKNGMEELSRWHTSRINKKIKNPFAYTSTVGCFNCDHKDEYIEDLEYTVKQYEQIGTEEECRTAREKMKPKKIILNSEPDREYEDYICPSCKDILQQRRKGATAILIYHFKHCPNCGQALDWSESEGK